MIDTAKKARNRAEKTRKSKLSRECDSITEAQKTRLRKLRYRKETAGLSEWQADNIITDLEEIFG